MATSLAPTDVPADARPADSTPLAVTVVLPCFNERDHVADELDRICAALDASPYAGDYEVHVLDDASTDGTADVVAGLLERLPAVRLTVFPRNGGSGTARRIGTASARGAIVVWTDADLSYPNERIPELVEHLQTHPHVDQVVGARTSEEGTLKLARVPAKWAIRRLAEFLSGTRIPDLNSGLRAFRRDVALPYLRLLPSGFSCVTTITLAFLHNQHLVDYVPIDYAKRAGRSKFHPIRDAYRYVLQVLRMVMYFNPLKVLMPVALTLLALGAGKAVYDVVVHPLRLAVDTLLIVTTGLVIAAVALLADLIVTSRDG